MKILLIDDDAAVLEVVSLMLASEGHAVLAAGSGREGLARLESGEAVDLVLTDLAMPHMSGWDVVRAVKTSWPATPVGLITGTPEHLRRTSRGWGPAVRGERSGESSRRTSRGWGPAVRGERSGESSRRTSRGWGPAVRGERSGACAGGAGARSGTSTGRGISRGHVAFTPTGPESSLAGRRSEVPGYGALCHSRLVRAGRRRGQERVIAGP